MRVVLASTKEQEEKIEELIQYMYSFIFPKYFKDCEIDTFIDIKVLHVDPSEQDQLYTLTIAFKAIASLQAIIHILELSNQTTDRSHLACLFDKNVKILEETGLFFPFLYKNFIPKNNETLNHCSIFSPASNEYLI